MLTIKDFIKRHSLAAYLALAFAISWGGVLIAVGPGGFPGTLEQFAQLLPIVVLAMLAGPSIAGILMTALANGKAGLRDLKSRLFRWRVGARWYAALLIAPLIACVVLLALSLFSPVFLPGILTADDKISHLLLGLVTGLAAGFFEELGWTGFAIPRLRERFSIIATGFIVGILWGAWHFLVVFWGSTSTLGDVSLAIYLPVMLFSFLVPYRLLMVWIYDRTASLLVAMLMHASLTASVRIFDPLAISGVPILTYNLLFGAMLWVVIAAIVLVQGGRLVRQPLEENRKESQSRLRTDPQKKLRQPTWQRIILLSVLGYEGLGALLGGALLVAAPDGRLMDMPVEIMHGFFSDFFIPGLILFALGILNCAAFVAVLKRNRTDWLFAGLALGGLAVWFIVEIAILRELHWLHAMWGLPVLLGGLAALPLVPSIRSGAHHSAGG